MVVTPTTDQYLHEQRDGCGVLRKHVVVEHALQEAEFGAVVHGGGKDGGGFLLHGRVGAGCLLEQRQGVVDGPAGGGVAVRGKERGKAVFEQGWQGLLCVRWRVD